MTIDIRTTCPVCGKSHVTRSTSNDVVFAARKAEKRLAEHQSTGCATWFFKAQDITTKSTT